MTRIRKVNSLPNKYFGKFKKEQIEKIEYYINEILKKIEKKAYYIVRYSMDKERLIEIATPTGNVLSLVYLSEISF